MEKTYISFAFIGAIVLLDMSQERRLKNANVEQSVKETRKRDVGVVAMLLSTIHVSFNKTNDVNLSVSGHGPWLTCYKDKA